MAKNGDLPRLALEEELVRLLNKAYGHWAVDNLAGREWSCPCDDCEITRTIWKSLKERQR